MEVGGRATCLPAYSALPLGQTGSLDVGVKRRAAFIAQAVMHLLCSKALYDILWRLEFL